MNRKLPITLALVAGTLATTAAVAQDNLFKFGLTRYTTHSRTEGVRGPGLPPGADAVTGDATTVLLIYERLFGPNFGAEIVLGVPPRIHADAAGSVAFLGEILSARNVAPTLLFNYHFGQPGDTLRPYLGAGINYTRFVSAKSPYGWDVSLEDSWGPAIQAGLDYALNRQWGVWASVASLKVRSKVVAVGNTVVQSTVDFRPIVYSMGLAYRF